MEPRRTPARRVGLAALAALLVFGASACSDGLVGKAPAATIDSSEISQAEVISATKATQRFYEYSIEKGQDTDGTLAAFVEDMKGESSYTVGTEGAAQVLSDMIVDDVIRQELKRQDALPTKEDRDKLRADTETQVGGAEALKKFPQAYIDRYLDRAALNTAFSTWAASEADSKVKPLTEKEREEKMRTLYEQIAPTRPLCLNAIQTATEAEASAAQIRVTGGEDFIAVSKSLAPEGQTVPDEGLVACLGIEEAKTAFGQDFSDKAVGDIVGPVAYVQQEGAAPVYLLLRVDGFDGQTYEEMLPQLEEAVPAQPEPTDPAQFDASDALDKLLKKADISVNPVFGRWSDAKQSVVPPAVPGGTTTTTAAANLPGS